MAQGPPFPGVESIRDGAVRKNFRHWPLQLDVNSASTALTTSRRLCAASTWFQHPRHVVSRPLHPVSTAGTPNIRAVCCASEAPAAADMADNYTGCGKSKDNESRVKDNADEADVRSRSSRRGPSRGPAVAPSSNELAHLDCCQRVHTVKNIIAAADAWMDTDPTPTPWTRRLSLIASVASLTQNLPLHEARAREHEISAAAHDLEGGHELQHRPHPEEHTNPEERGRPYHPPEHVTCASNPQEDHHAPAGQSPPMPSKKSKSRSPNPSARRNGNGHTATSAASPSARAADMNGGSLVERRTHPHASLDIPDEDSADSTARLMGRSTFSLDQAPELPKMAAQRSVGYFDLPEQDRRNFLWLVLLYFLQGIPMGLAGGSVPFLMKSHMSYAQLGVFSLASYPYSLKLLWSPIVDAVWSSRVGRRKSWILPIQTLSGFGMLWLGARAEQMMSAAGADNGAGVWGFTGWWFALVFMCATQDIAVDGWALTLLSPSNLSYASTAQTVGLTAGQFLSYTVFLALSSPDFANKYFRSSPLSTGLLTLNSYLQFWGWAYLLVTAALALLKREDRTREKDSILDVYKTMWGILKLRNIGIFIVIHLIAKIGFQANDAVTNLKLLDKGFSQEDLALTVLIDFPFEISLGYYAGKWSEQFTPIRVWCWAFVGRLIAAVFAQLVVMFFPTATGTTNAYLGVIIVEHVFSTFMSTVMFVAISAFHAKIADPAIGGTYMTLLATVSNLGGTFPRFFVLKFVDAFTQAACIPPSAPNPLAKPLLTSRAVTETFSCVAEAEKLRCLAGGGTCVIQRDGYYIVNVLCVLFGVVTFWGFIRPAAGRLQALPLRAWRIAGG